MCDYFWQRMQAADQGGDLADIVRSVNAAAAAGGASGPSTSSSDITAATTDSASWQYPADPPLPHLPPADDLADAAGLRDPLLHELTGTGGASAYFSSGPGPDPDKSGSDIGGGATTSTSCDQLLAHNQRLLVGDGHGGMRRPCSNLFSRVLQISPAAKPSPLKPLAPLVPADVVKLDHSPGQIPSLRNPGLKRRKSQAKKVVCIPAAAAASSRPSGEVVPSDLWAWRKYGQKPIKGSPYPRGYYRCSSSKGCSARKQVERSRTDPNMLVITYTSEHNHPWPTQRNALAGSTRAQPSKTPSSAASRGGRPLLPKEEPVVKQEVVAGDQMESASTASMAVDGGIVDKVFDDVFALTLPESGQPDDFFADLVELEPESMSLIFSRPEEFMPAGKVDENREEEEKEGGGGGKIEGMDDPFINMFDWGGGSSMGGHQYHQAKKGL